MAEESKQENNNQSNHVFILAILIVCISLLGLYLVSGVAIYNKPESAKDILNLFLPVLGTWVGAVIAYYFSKENFESANRSVKEMVRQITPMEKLKTIAAKDKMIPVNQMTCLNLSSEPLDKANIKTTLLQGKMKDKNRLPVLNGDNSPLYMIHKSMIDKFIAERALSASSSVPSLSDLTLKNLLEQDPQLKIMFENGFAVVREDASLADAKVAMEQKDNCSDVFVTKNGTKKEPVIGWLTNLIITENAKVGA